MHYVLVILLFITPPNGIRHKDKGTKNDHRVWSLQSATAMDVSSNDWCDALANTIDATINTTATVTTRMLCIPKDEKDFIAGQQPQISATPSRPLQEYSKSLGLTEEQLQCQIQNAITVGTRVVKACK
jgi:hypothetical protein